MKTLFKILGLSFLLLLLLKSPLTAQDSSEILKIREQFNSWQKVLNKETIAKGKKFFEISVGRNFSKTEWITKLEDDNDFIWSEVAFIKDDKLGSMFYIYETSPSGDWADAAEHYYWPTGELLFVYWKLNTFHSIDPSPMNMRPITIERRLYFNKNGTMIKFLESIYFMGTKAKVTDPDYEPHEVTYWKNIKALPFYNLLNE
jgi:hypothetical protein